MGAKNSSVKRHVHKVKSGVFFSSFSFVWFLLLSDRVDTSHDALLSCTFFCAPLHASTALPDVLLCALLCRLLLSAWLLCFTPREVSHAGWLLSRCINDEHFACRKKRSKRHARSTIYSVFVGFASPGSAQPLPTRVRVDDNTTMTTSARCTTPPFMSTDAGSECRGSRRRRSSRPSSRSTTTGHGTLSSSSGSSDPSTRLTSRWTMSRSVSVVRGWFYYYFTAWFTTELKG